MPRPAKKLISGQQNQTQVLYEGADNLGISLKEAA